MPPSNLAELSLEPIESEPQLPEEFTRTSGAFGAGGYRRGYSRALQNLLASLVPLAEQHLRAKPSARRDVYAFIEFLEQHLERTSSQAGYVADGLGI